MYEKFFAESKFDLKPVLDMLEINGGAVEKLVKQQADFINDLVKAGVAHSKALAESKDLTAVAELQKAYFTDFGQKVMDATKQNLDVIVDAKDQVTKVVEASFKGVQSKPAKAAPAAAPAPKKAAA